MAVTVTESWQGQSARAEASADLKGILLSDTIIYQVEVDVSDYVFENKWLALNATGIPAVYDVHPYNTWLYAKDKSVTPIGPKLFQVAVNYTAMENPLDMDPDISWDYNITQEPIDKDIYNNAITNSSGESPDPPIVEDFADLILRIRRNQEYFNPIVAASVMNRVNESAFYGFAAGEAKCVIYRGSPKRSGSLYYYEVEIEVHFRYVGGIGWSRRFLDQGFREYTGVNSEGKPKYEKILDENSRAVNQPVLLDGEGKKKADADPAVYLTYNTKYYADFSVLGI